MKEVLQALAQKAGLALWERDDWFHVGKPNTRILLTVVPDLYTPGNYDVMTDVDGTARVLVGLSYEQCIVDCERIVQSAPLFFHEGTPQRQLVAATAM